MNTVVKFSSVLFTTFLQAVMSQPVLAECVDKLHGQLTQGGLVWGNVKPGSKASIDDEALDVLPSGLVFFGFHRDAPSEAVLIVESADGKVCRENLNIAQREYNIQRVEGVPQKTVTPSEEHMARIRAERAKVGSAKRKRYARPDLLQETLLDLSWPAVGPISGVYGSQRYYNGTPRSPHYGVDVAVPAGTPVQAPSPGIVTLAEPDLFYSGGTVILDHGFGLSSSFLHMSKVSVEVGQELAVGDVLGEVGATGRATGPHLDWRMSWRNRRIDPQLLVPPMPGGQ